MDKTKLRQKEREKYTEWYYENEYWKEDDTTKENHRYQYNDPGHKKRFAMLTKILTDNFKFKNFLDVGCGMGHIVRNLSNKKIKGLGTEVSKDAIKKHLSDLNKKKRIVFAGAEKLPFKDNQFDLVYCFDVMEHVLKFDVDSAVKELARVTNKYLILTINLDNPYEYHPSMFTRKEWEFKFLKTKKLKQLTELQNKIERKCKKTNPEYDFFVFEKIK